SAAVATLVAVSKARVSTPEKSPEKLIEQGFFRACERDRPMRRIHVGQTYLGTHRRKRTRRRLGPLDEADRVGEVRLQVAPLGRGESLQAKEVEVRDVRVGLVAVAD